MTGAIRMDPLNPFQTVFFSALESQQFEQRNIQKCNFELNVLYMFPPIIKMRQKHVLKKQKHNFLQIRSLSLKKNLN